VLPCIICKDETHESAFQSGIIQAHERIKHTSETNVCPVSSVKAIVIFCDFVSACCAWFQLILIGTQSRLQPPSFELSAPYMTARALALIPADLSLPLRVFLVRSLHPDHFSRRNLTKCLWMRLYQPDPSFPFDCSLPGALGVSGRTCQLIKYH